MKVVGARPHLSIVDPVGYLPMVSLEKDASLVAAMERLHATHAACAAVRAAAT